MDVKIRHKLIEIEDQVSDRFVILGKSIKSIPLSVKGILMKCLW